MSPKLITTIIAIIIGILATIAGIRYGGEAFNEGRMKSEVLKLTNQMDQVAGAAQLYMVDHGELPTSTELNGRSLAQYLVEEHGNKYLDEIPSGTKISDPEGTTPPWEIEGSYLNSNPINDEQFCAYINKDHGGSGLVADIPSCSEPRDQYNPCCVN
jgi:hypothetical protein